MGDLREDIHDGDGGRLSDVNRVNGFYNKMVKGPFVLSHTLATIDSGVPLWTPSVGDRILGLWVEFTEGWSVAGEEIGIGIAGTTDGDLAYRFPLSATVPTPKITFPRGQGVGAPLGGEVIRILTEDPLVARTVIGGNTTGGLTLWVNSLPGHMF